MSTNKNAADKLELFLDRVRGLAEGDKDADVARELGVPASSIPTWRKRGTIPYGTLIDYAITHDVSLDWLFSNDGLPPKTYMELTAKRTERRLASLEGDDKKVKRLEAEMRQLHADYKLHAINDEPAIYKVNRDPDLDLLERVIVAVEQAVEQEHLAFDRDKYARLVRLIYQHFLDNSKTAPQDVNVSNVIPFVKAANL